MKKLLSICMCVLFAVVLACPAMASDKQLRYVGDGQIRGSIGNSSFVVVADTSVGAERVEVSGTLYESGRNGYTSIASCSNSSNSGRCTATGSFSRKSGRTYRLEYSATFYYDNGTHETVTGSITG